MTSPYFDTVSYVRTGEKDGRTAYSLIAGPPGKYRMGTLSAKAWAIPPIEFSAPGPPCVMMTPNLLRLLTRAVSVSCHDCTAFVPEHDRPDTLLGNRFDELIGRKAGYPFNIFDFQYSCYGLCCVHLLRFSFNFGLLFHWWISSLID